MSDFNGSGDHIEALPYSEAMDKMETVAVFYDDTGQNDIHWPVVSEQPAIMRDGRIGFCAWDRILTENERNRIIIYWKYQSYPRISRKRKKEFKKDDFRPGGHW